MVGALVVLLVCAHFDSDIEELSEHLVMDVFLALEGEGLSACIYNWC